MKIRYFKYFAVTLLIGVWVNSSFAQDFNLKNYRVKFSLSTVKQADGSRLLKVDFTSRNKKDRKDKPPVYGATVDFFNVLNDQEIKLGSATTDKDGTAKLIIPNQHQYLKDSLGYMHFKATFEGSGKMKSKDDELSVKDIVLDLNLEEIDSVKTIALKAYTLDSLSNKTAANPYVVFAVEGMISNRPIKETSLKKGAFDFELPENIKGNAQGNVTVVVKIDDSDEFGTVYQKQTAPWGTAVTATSDNTNLLWTKAAPIWMYVVLTILLVGVWANYAYTIANLFKIKKEGT